MKRLFYILLIFVLISGISNAKQRVVVNLATGEINKIDAKNPNAFEAMQKYIQPIPGNPNEVNGTVDKNGIPRLLRLDFQPIEYRSYIDTSDSGITYPPVRPTDPPDLDSVRFEIGGTGISKNETGVNANETITGTGQIFAGLPGDFQLDSVMLLAYVYLNTSTGQGTAVNQDFQVYPITVLNVNMWDTTSFKSLKLDINDYGIKWNMLTPDGNLINVTQAALNNTIDWSKNQITGITLPFNPPIVLAPNQNFGFILVASDPTTLTGSVQWRGVYEWNSPASYSLACYYLHYSSGASSSDSIVNLGSYYKNYIYAISTMFSTYPPWDKYPQYQSYFTLLETTQYRKSNLIAYAYGEFQASVEQNTYEAQPFNLEQNTPNPVSNNTTIKFALEHQSMVTLRIYNAMGQLVDELTNKILSQGTYSTLYDTSDLISGSYFYVLTADNQSITKCMQVVH